PGPAGGGVAGALRLRGGQASDPSQDQLARHGAGAIGRVEVGEDGRVQVQELEDLADARPADLLAPSELGRRAVGVLVEPRAPASSAIELRPDASEGASPGVYRRLLGARPARMARSIISWPDLSRCAWHGRFPVARSAVLPLS